MSKLSDILDFLSADESSRDSFVRLFTSYMGYMENAALVSYWDTKPRNFLMVRKIISALKSNYAIQFSHELEKLLLSKARELDENCFQRTQLIEEGQLNTEDDLYKSDCVRCANELELELLNLYAELHSGGEGDKQPFAFFDLYSPSKAKTDEAEKLIRSAIQMIEFEINLTARAKQKVIQHLEKALRTLKYGNNTEFFGITKEILAVLGALGSFAGGYIACLEQVENNMREAEKVVEETSIQRTDISLNDCMEYIEIRLPFNQDSSSVLPFVETTELIEGSLNEEDQNAEEEK